MYCETDGNVKRGFEIEPTATKCDFNNLTDKSAAHLADYREVCESIDSPGTYGTTTYRDCEIYFDCRIEVLKFLHHDCSSDFSNPSGA